MSDIIVNNADILRDGQSLAETGWLWAQNPANPLAYPIMQTLNSWGGWSIAQWMQWHAAMKTAYGVDYANTKFLTAWQDDNILNGPPLSERLTNTAFKDYARANGFYDGLFYGLGALTKPVASVVDVTDAASDGITNTAKLLRVLIPLAAVGVGVYFAAPYIAPHLKRAIKAIKA